MSDITDGFVYRLSRKEAKVLLRALNKANANLTLPAAEDQQLRALVEALEWDITPCLER